MIVASGFESLLNDKFRCHNTLEGYLLDRRFIKMYPPVVSNCIVYFIEASIRFQGDTGNSFKLGNTGFCSILK